MTSTDVAIATNTALAIRAEQTNWTESQLAVLRHIGTEKATKADLDVFFHVCRQTGLDPFARQIYMVDYGGKPTIQTGIDGFRLIARRAADKAGHAIEYGDIQWCGPDGQWVDVWLSPEPPAAARAVVLRDGKRFPHVAVFTEYVGMKGIYQNNRKVGEEVNAMWKGKPANQIGKCAEAGALRKAFPQDLGGVYIEEEMQHEVVRGEVVREDAPADGRLDGALALVAGASSREELAGVWSSYGPSLSVTDLARLSAAIKSSPAYAVEEPATEEAAEVEDPPY